MSKNILVFGATSAIADHLCRLYAKQGASFYLVARSAEKLQATTNNLLVLGSKKVYFEATDFVANLKNGPLLANCSNKLGNIDLAILAHGLLPEQARAETDLDYLTYCLEVNTNSSIRLLTEIAKLMQTQGHGHLVVLSSCAGERGRQSNYLYGASKSALTTFCSGLRNRLYKKNITISTVLPGFIDTPMTNAFKKGFLWRTPQQIAPILQRGIEKKQNIIYLPWFWKPIMAIIKAIPEGLFKRLTL